MAVDLTIVKKYLTFISLDLQQAFAQDGIVMDFESGTEILQEGQSVKMIPLVLEGLIKVFTRNEDKELLLYYIEPKESCVMSFLAGIKNKPSKIFAVTEKATKVILLPSHKVEAWTHQYPALNTLFYDLYNTRYSELIDTLNQLIFQKLDGRLYEYLKEKGRVKSTTLLDLRHREIAQELGTSREVITRVLKKLEKEGKIRQRDTGIELI
jgi:CRP/FNR family transcriptional regulator, anaerobic regulatory protein